MSSSGHFLAATDNSYDIGASGASRPRNIYAGSSVRSSDVFIASSAYWAGTTKRTVQYMSGDEFRWVRETNAGVFEAVVMRLDASGNLGLGVATSATTGGYINSQVGGAVLMGKASTAEAYLNNNATFNSGWKYIYNGPAVRYEQVSGHAWHIAPSGTAGNAITFTQAMTLDASGNLGVGVSSPSVRLHVDSGSADEAVRVNGTGSPFLAVNLSSVRQVYLQATASFVNFWVEANKPLRFATNDVSRWQISATGHFIGHVDNTYDIGASGATRPRSVYAATSVEGGYIRAGAASAGAASTTTIGNGTATTVGAAGAASALPANPLGYIIAHVGTTQVKIPYYNN
jgi:hypothetical protein